MGLNISKGNMYEFVTHTWNTVKGKCPHGCIYCYMKRYGNQKPIRFDEKELNTDLGQGNFIFVGSSCDMFAEAIPEKWIIDTIKHCGKFDNEYLFQTKNPSGIRRILPTNSNVCTTLETNRHYPKIMQNSPPPEERAKQMMLIRHRQYITIEPIMDFDFEKFLDMIWYVNPIQVNIGADSGGHNLPEPGKEKILELITKLESFTKVVQKKNLSRILDK